MTKESILKYLEEVFGIKSESELNAAMASAEKLNVGIMTKGAKNDKSNRLHIKNAEWHLIYKYDGSPIGWYARNVKTNDDVYLGSGASPSIVLETLTVKNEEFWNSLLCPEAEEIAEEGSE